MTEAVPLALDEATGWPWVAATRRRARRRSRARPPRRPSTRVRRGDSGPATRSSQSAQASSVPRTNTPSSTIRPARPAGRRAGRRSGRPSVCRRRAAGAAVTTAPATGRTAKAARRRRSANEHDGHDEHERQREQPAAALDDQHQLQLGTGQREQQSAHQSGQLTRRPRGRWRPARPMVNSAAVALMYPVGAARRPSTSSAATWSADASRISSTTAMHPDPEREHRQRDQRARRRPGQDQHQGEQQQVQQGPVAALERVARGRRPGDRQI